MLYTYMTLNGSATNMLHYHYQLCIFWHQYYEYVYHYNRDSINHLHWVYDHRRLMSLEAMLLFSQRGRDDENDSRAFRDAEISER